MADIKISDLQVASSVSDADIVVINQGGTTKTAARSLIKNAGTVTSVIAGTGLTGGTITGSGTIALSSPVSIANGGTGQSAYTDGQLLIGNTTENTLTKATLTAGTGMTVTNGSGAITLTAKGLGPRVKTVGIDAPSIQDCINLCTDADGEHPYTVLIPPIAGSYTEPLTLKGSVSLIGLTTSLNADAVQITGTHTFTPASAQANTNRINFQNLTFISGGTSSNTITCSSSTKYFSKLTFSGCIFSGNKADTYSHIKTDDNVAVYVDNCRFESSAGGSASAGITQGNGPLYLSNNTTFNVYGRAIDVPVATFPVTRTATVTAGSPGGTTTMTLTSGDTTGLAVGMKISGANVGSTVTIVSLTAPSTVVMSTTPLTSGSFTATFGQTPYVEIHDSVLAGKGAETVRLGNGLLTCNTSNFTNTATVASSGFAGSGINMLTGYVSAAQSTTVGIVNSSFTISDTTAYTITGLAAPVFAALNGISYSNGIPGLLYSTLIGANVTVYDYNARATSIQNGGTGATTAAAARTALSVAASGANTDITSVALTSGSITTAPTTANHIVNKTYADAIGSGINFHDAADYATTAALSAAYTYANGTSGVGATITANANGTLTIDGYTFIAGDVGKRILIKNETGTYTNNTTPSAAFNGVYTLTTVGTASVRYVLTRATDYDTSGTGTNEINQGDFILVLNGATLANTAWVQQARTPISVGTTSLSFTQFAAAAPGVTTFSAGTTGFTPNSASSGAVTLGGQLAIGSGGTGQATQQAAITALTGTQTAGRYLRSDGTNAALAAIQAGDITGTVTVGNGGTGATDASTARTNLSAATFADVQIFTTSGTWTKPTGAKSISILLLGAGGGGGGGRKDSGTLVARSGGGGGGGGSFINISIPASAFGATESVTVSAGGTGGAGSATTANGTAGNNGGSTIFGGSTAFNVFTAPGGGGGSGGSSTAATGGYTIIAAHGGGASSITATATTAAPATTTSSANYGGAGGGGGGGISALDVAFAGGDGGRGQVLNYAGGIGGAATGANGGSGTSNTGYTTGVAIVGSGGGGGGAGLTVSGGTGGTGGNISCGGGGGGASRDGTSGAGGNGGVGLAIITTYF